MIEMIRKEILNVLEETFVKHHGIYTDKGTSFFETLAAIDHAAASKRYPGLDETIAGHVFHTKFYIVVLQEYITDKRTGKTDWSESWVVKTVTADEWRLLVESLRAEYETLKTFVETLQKWEHEDYFGGVLAILVHCAYHLGAVRQLKEF